MKVIDVKTVFAVSEKSLALELPKGPINGLKDSCAILLAFRSFFYLLANRMCLLHGGVPVSLIDEVLSILGC